MILPACLVAIILAQFGSLFLDSEALQYPLIKKISEILFFTFLLVVILLIQKCILYKEDEEPLESNRANGEVQHMPRLRRTPKKKLSDIQLPKKECKVEKSPKRRIFESSVSDAPSSRKRLRLKGKKQPATSDDAFEEEELNVNRNI
jgi:hypothetical protein